MLGMNLWGTIYNMIFMFGWPGAIGYDAIRFCKQHPEAAWDIFLYCLCGAVGQNFIFLTISRFGSLTNTTITTTRKFVSIVVSSLLSGNPLSEKQWGSVVMVFTGLSYQIYLKWKKLQRMQKKRKSTWVSSWSLLLRLIILNLKIKILCERPSGQIVGIGIEYLYPWSHKFHNVNWMTGIVFVVSCYISA